MASPAPPKLDFNNIQGDILSGLPKKTETYYFFTIEKNCVHEFRKQLTHFIPLITTTAEARSGRSKVVQHRAAPVGQKPIHVELSGVNLVFSHKGFVQLGIKDDVGDQIFTDGMLKDAANLGDRGAAPTVAPSDWIPAFKGDIHGMIKIAADSHETVNKTLADIKKIFRVGSHNATIHEVIKIVGDVRPGKEKGHEHFGFLDGISQPAILGVDDKLNPGQESIHQGIILCGRDGDNNAAKRPSWALDGSFLAFRYLFQLVPEFNNFLKENPIPGLPADKGSELLGARLVGRWKSGAPIDITPLKDDPKLGADPTKNNDFRYAFPDDPTQTRCPFAAHTRKTNPRADLEDQGIKTDPQRIIRRGIQFGPEVSHAEATSGTTHQGRGLLFACYQSSIANGFQFIQKSWANNPGFIFGKSVQPGLDPIIGQTTAGGLRVMSGTNPDPKAQSEDLSLTAEWVIPKGGEYFFAPSISALKTVFALAK